MNRIRTIQGAADELRKRDPGCAISAHNIRQLVLHKEIPSRKAGSKYLVALDDPRPDALRHPARGVCGHQAERHWLQVVSNIPFFILVISLISYIL